MAIVTVADRIRMVRKHLALLEDNLNRKMSGNAQDDDSRGTLVRLNVPKYVHTFIAGYAKKVSKSHTALYTSILTGYCERRESLLRERSQCLDKASWKKRQEIDDKLDLMSLTVAHLFEVGETQMNSNPYKQYPTRYVSVWLSDEIFANCTKYSAHFTGKDVKSPKWMKQQQSQQYTYLAILGLWIRNKGGKK